MHAQLRIQQSVGFAAGRTDAAERVKTRSAFSNRSPPLSARHIFKFLTSTVLALAAASSGVSIVKKEVVLSGTITRTESITDQK